MRNLCKSTSRTRRNYRITDHAKRRCQQRGISTRTIDLILTHGERHLCRDACSSVYLTNKSIAKVRHFLPKADVIQMEKQRRVYLIVDEHDAVVITTYWGHGSR